MKAVILAAGQAVRLRPVTHDTPKCLLQVGDNTIIDLQIKVLKDSGINDVTIVTGFKADILEKHLSRHHSDINLTFIRNDKFESTKPGYALWLIKEKLSGPIVYLNADLLCEPSIIKEIINSKKSSTAIQKIEWNEEAVNVIMDNDSRLLAIGKKISKEESHGEFIGATKFSGSFSEVMRSILSNFDEEKWKNAFAVDVINEVIKNGKEPMYGLDVTDKIAVEIDTIADYENAKTFWQKYQKDVS
jgi:choline kinase